MNISEGPPSSGNHRPSQTDNLSTENEPLRDKPNRAVIACTACRTRKIKCSGARPTCQACAKSASECIYPAGSKRRREFRGSEARCLDVQTPHSFQPLVGAPFNEAFSKTDTGLPTALPVTEMTDDGQGSDLTASLDWGELLGFNPLVFLENQHGPGLSQTSPSNSDPPPRSRPKSRLRVPYFRSVRIGSIANLRSR